LWKPPLPENMTIRETISHGSSVLKTAGIESHSLDSSLLLALVLNISRESLISKGNEPLSDEAFATFQTLLERRKNGECTAYILGKKEFRGLEFLVNSSVLVPRPDTEILVEAAIEQLTESKKQITRVLDLCTGSGAVAAAIKYEISDIEVHAADISANALVIAKKNAQRLVGGSVNFFQGDLFDALPTFSYSLIVCNPPYIPTDEIKTLSAEVQNEPRLALDGGKSGLEIIERIIEKAPEYLEEKGILLMEADPRQMEKIKRLLKNRGFSEIIIYNDLSGQQRVIGGKYDK
jgi:release factor glutamine methyltransferase